MMQRATSPATQTALPVCLILAVILLLSPLLLPAQAVLPENQSAAAPGDGDSSGALDSAAKKEIEKKLSSISSQINTINKKLEELKSEKSSLLNEIYAIELQQEKEIIESHKLELQLRITRDKIDAQEKEKIILEKDIAKSRDNLRKMIRVLYKLGGNTYLKIFIRIDSIDQLFKNYRLFAVLIGYKAKEIDRIKENIKKLNAIKAQLLKDHDTIQLLKIQQDQKIFNIRNFKQNKLKLLQNINNDRQDFLQLLDELKLEAERIGQVMEGKKSKTSLRIIDYSKIRGRLPWPLPGRVITTYGMKKSNRFNTYTIDNGITIQPTGADQIRAVLPGEVVLSEYYKGYGKLVIVQHSRDLFTLYGHCDQLLKNKNEMVDSDDVIALAGSSGSASGKSLYFELRYKTKTADPLQWLQKNPGRGRSH